MGILVEKVRISNFRSLKNIEINLAPLTLLVGANNAGKTSLLKAINLCLGVDRRHILKEDFNLSPDDDGREKKIKIDIRIIPVDDKGKRENDFNAVWRDTVFGDLINVDKEDRQYVAFRTEASFSPTKNDYEIKRFRINNWKEEKNDWENVNYDDALKTSFQSIPLFFIDAQRDILEDLRSRSSYLGRLISKIKIQGDKIKELEERIRELNDDIVGNSEILSHLKDRLSELNSAIPSGSTGVDITPVNKRIRDLNKGLNINFKDGENESFPLEYHGMGTRSWASLLTFKAYTSWLINVFEKEGASAYHPILALEEPEAHLHPNGQRHLYSQLQTVGGQKIISTHSPYVAGQCLLAEIRHFYKTDDNPQVSIFDDSQLSSEDVRRLRREIMHSRGELFFARAIVLFEGETEEQALPIYAKAYFGCHPFEIGLNFVGVGGQGNYLPFIRFCEAFHIPWFILSDGEDNAIKAVTSALRNQGLDMNQATNVKIIPNKNDFEKMLLADGYKNEIAHGIVKTYEPFKNELHKTAKSKKINGWNEDKLYEHMDNNKTSVCSPIAETISSLEDKTRRFPAIVRSLLAEISTKTKIPMAERNA
jgi:putative ATP-dependent endonuclease of OLD family